jgi:hypothetical protein
MRLVVEQGKDCVVKRNGCLPAREKSKINIPMGITTDKANATCFGKIIPRESFMAIGPWD